MIELSIAESNSRNITTISQRSSTDFGVRSQKTNRTSPPSDKAPMARLIAARVYRPSWWSAGRSWLVCVASRVNRHAENQHNGNAQADCRSSAPIRRDSVVLSQKHVSDKRELVPSPPEDEEP